MTFCKIDSQWEHAVWHGRSDGAPLFKRVGRGGRWSEVPGGGHTHARGRLPADMAEANASCKAVILPIKYIIEKIFEKNRILQSMTSVKS